jgi:hypothetical protein
MHTLDLRTGPGDGHPYVPEDLVRCRYVKPRQPLSGNTPKFLCHEAGAERRKPVKIKWGEENGEMYAEIAGTRLLWALGFPADRVYPVRVECIGCSADPWRHPEHDAGRTREFDPASLERQFPGRTIEEYDGQGWTWEELRHVDPAAGGAPRAHVDALKLLAAFIQHRDTKHDNQRLVCPPDALVETEARIRRGCRQPVMMVQDLGSVFGGPSLLASHKMSLAAWEKAPLWKDPQRCIAWLTSEPDSSLGIRMPVIGDEGRRFLSTLLDALDDGQIRALFEAARADRRGGVARWVAAFKRRRDGVREPVPGAPTFHCPEP